MTRKADPPSRRARFEIATINGETGQMQRAKPVQRPEKMTLKLLKEALEGLQLVPLDGEKTLTPYVALSAQQPYVAGKGWLEAIHARTFFAANPSMSWIPEAGQITGFLDVWLDGLAPNTLYVAQIEVGSIGAGAFEIQAVTLGASVVQQTVDPGAGFHTLLLLFETADGGLAKIKVSNTDWSFYEITVSAMT